MSKVETQTKPIIQDMILRGSATGLKPPDLAKIAVFAFLKAVVADHMHDNRPPFFTFSERHSFAEGLTIPVGVQMWLASTVGTRGLFKSYTTESVGNNSRSLKIQAFTYGLGHFVVQMTVFRWKKIIFRRQRVPSLPPLTQHGIWDSLAISFWPLNGTIIHWPPPKSLPDDSIDTFAKRWTKLEWA